MKGSFTVGSGALASAVKYTARWIDPKPATPIYGGLLFDADGAGRLTIAAQNGDAAASATVPVEGDASGKFVVAGRLLDKLVGTFPQKPVTFEQVGSAVAIVAGSWRGSLPAMPENDYPSLPRQALLAGTVEGGALADAVHRIAATAHSNTETFIPLTGVHLSFDEDSALHGVKADDDGQAPATLTLTATDRNSAARQSIVWSPDDDGAPFGEAALVFAHVLADAVDAFAGSDPVAIGYESKARGAGVFSLTTPARSLVARTVGGEFPDLGPMFTETKAASATVRPADLVLPLKRAVMLDDSDHPAVTVRFGDNLISLSAGSEGRGDGEEEVEGVAYSGPECSMVLRAGMFHSAMSTVPGDTAVLSFNPGTTRPVTVTSPGDPTWRHLVMPLRKTGGQR